MRHIGADVSVGQHKFPGAKRGFHLGFRFQAVPGIQQRGEVRIDRLQRAKLPVQVAPHKLSVERFVPRKTDLKRGQAACLERASKQFQLSPLSRPINSFESNQFSARGHCLFRQSSVCNKLPQGTRWNRPPQCRRAVVAPTFRLAPEAQAEAGSLTGAEERKSKLAARAENVADVRAKIRPVTPASRQIAEKLARIRE